MQCILHVLLTLEALHVHIKFMCSFKCVVLNQAYNKLDPTVTGSCPRSPNGFIIFCFYIYISKYITQIPFFTQEY